LPVHATEAARDHADDDADRVQHRSDDEHLCRLGEDALVDRALGQQRTGLHRQGLDEHKRGTGHRGLAGARNRRNVNGAVFSSTWVNGTCAWVLGLGLEDGLDSVRELGRHSANGSPAPLDDTAPGRRSP
jgi:hypothetical protein